GAEPLQLFEQERLADPALSDYDGELAVAGDRRVQAVLKLRELVLAADEGGGRRPLDHAAGGQDHGAGELVAVEARPVAFERLGDLPRPLGAPGRVLLQALEHDPLELLADLGPQRAGRLGDLVDDAVEDRLDFSGKRRLAGQTPVQDGPKRENVGAPAEGVAGALPGGGEGNRPNAGPGLGQ